MARAGLYKRQKQSDASTNNNNEGSEDSRVPQVESLNPLAQRQVKVLCPSTQVAPFWQGFESQLFTTISGKRKKRKRKKGENGRGPQPSSSVGKRHRTFTASATSEARGATVTARGVSECRKGNSSS